MRTINSRQNPRIKALAALKKPKGRRDQEKFLAEGLRVVSAMVEAGWQPLELLVTEASLKKAQNLVPEKLITLVTQPVMEKLSQSSTPSGMLAVFKLPKKPKTEKLGPGIVLAQIADPGNMGTLIRTTAAMGFNSVVVVEGADPWSHKVVQASAGALAQVSLFCWSWEKLLKNKGDKELVALVTIGGQAPEKLKNKNCLLIVGNEAHGIPPEWIKTCDKKITLPISNKVESLNAAVAGSIALFLIRP